MLIFSSKILIRLKENFQLGNIHCFNEKFLELKLVRYVWQVVRELILDRSIDRNKGRTPQNDSCYNLYGCVLLRRTHVSKEPVEGLDEDVAAEKDRVLSGGARRDLVRLENLTKVRHCDPRRSSGEWI